MLANLIEYAKREGIEAEAGFTPKTVQWIVRLSNSGKFLGVIPQSESGKKRRGRVFPKVPHLRFSGDTPMRQFLVDTLKYALLFGEDHPDEKLRAKHEYFLQLLRDVAETDEAFGIIANAIGDPETRAAICEELAKPEQKAKPTENVTFAVNQGSDVRVLVEETSWHDWWRDHFPKLLHRGDGDKPPMRCLITGEIDEIADTHPKVKGLGGVGDNIETTLVSFNKDSFCSYGLEQSRNAAISKSAAQQYVAALNHAIERGETLAGAKVAYWYVGETIAPQEDLVAHVIGPVDFGEAEVEEDEDDDNPPSSSEIRQIEANAGELLTAIRKGQRADLARARFNALTLSGNAGRVVVRDWMEGQFETLAENVGAWFNDLAIVSRDGREIIKSHKFAAILSATVRDMKDVAAPMVANLWHCAFQNKPIPYEAMAQALRRATLDVINGDSPCHARMGLLRAFCKRKGIDMKTEMNPELTHPAYLCGRIMAILAQIQHAALGDVGAGVVQKYYAAASATPALVLGRLVRLAQVGHLPKIEGGLQNWFEKQLAEVWSLLKQTPLAPLSLEEQTLFAMGYYQQQAKRFGSKNDADERCGNKAQE